MDPPLSWARKPEIRGLCIIPAGDPSDHCSYRSEAGGLYGLICALRLICEFYHIDSPLLAELGCDGDGPLKKVFDKRRAVDPTSLHILI